VKTSKVAYSLRVADGFTMVECAVACCFIFTVTGFALLNIQGILPAMRANEASNQMLTQLRVGRELAISQRRNIEVRFVGNNQIEFVRADVPSGTTLLSRSTLENSFQFQLFNGVPDTPDSFGNAAAVDFHSASKLFFLSDGTFVDAQGNPLNGSIFVGLPNRPETARAVTVLGATGRVRAYRWTGSKWIQ
jgi:Tfp pilus assembly protein FimT